MPVKKFICGNSHVKISYIWAVIHGSVGRLGWVLSNNMHLYAEVPCASTYFTISEISFMTYSWSNNKLQVIVGTVCMILAYISMLVFRRGHHHINSGYVAGGIWYGNQQARRSESDVFLFDKYFITYLFKSLHETRKHRQLNKGYSLLCIIGYIACFSSL